MRRKKLWMLLVSLLSVMLFAACSNGEEVNPEDEPTNLEMTPEDEPVNSDIVPEESTNNEGTTEDESSSSDEDSEE